MNRGGYRYNMPHKEYWEQRSKEQLSESFATTEQVNTYLENVYKKSLLDFSKKYEQLVSPFVVDGEIDVVALRRAQATNPAFLYKYQRLVAEIDLFSESMNEKQQKQVLNALKKVYKDTVIETFKDFKKSAKGLEILNTAAIERAVRNPFTRDGREFSDRIWNNLSTMNKNLRYSLSQSIAQGKSIQKTTAEFKKIYGNTTYNTSRLIRTETLATYSKASRDSYKELGVEEMEVLAEADACDVCGSYDGKRISVVDGVLGVDYPPFHPFCRCCVMPVVRGE